MKIRGLLDTDKMFAYGGDENGGDPPRIEAPPARPTNRKPRTSREDDEEDDEEDDHISNPKDRKIAKLSREANRRRIKNRELTDELEAKEQEIETLRGQVNDATKLQKAFDKLKTEKESQEETVRRFAIRAAIEKDAVKNEKGEATPRAWYDVDMVESLLDRKVLSVDTNDFSVGGLTDQLDAIAKEKPFLVKSSENSSKEDRQDQQQPNYRQPSGQAPQSSATGNQEQQRSQNEAQMLADFPALQNVV